MNKIILSLGDIYNQYKALDYMKGINYRKYDIINFSIWLVETISKELLYKQWCTKIKLDNQFIDILQAPCVVNTVKFDNFIFGILKYGMVYNLLKSENFVYT